MADVQIIDRDGAPLGVDVEALTALVTQRWRSVSPNGDVSDVDGVLLDVSPPGDHGFVVTVTEQVAWCDGTIEQTAEVIDLVRRCVPDPTRLLLLSDDASMKLELRGPLDPASVGAFDGWEPVTDEDVARWERGSRPAPPVA